MQVRTKSTIPRSSFDAALARVRFHFQPIVAARERRVTGYEALARPSAEDAAVGGGGPAAFVATARRLGRSREFSAALLRATSDALSRLPAPTRLYINVSRDDLEHGIFLGLAPLASRIVLEMDVGECIGIRRASVREYRAYGFRFAADDLRAGRDALAAIVALEPDTYKLDRSLLRGIEAEPLRRSAIRTLLDLGARNGAEVICEGIERTAEREILVDLGADLMQGFLFGIARPLRRPRTRRTVLP